MIVKGKRSDILQRNLIENFRFQKDFSEKIIRAD